MKKIRYGKQTIGGLQKIRAVSLQRQQLKERVKRQELQACRGKYLRPWDAFESTLHHSVCPRITIMKWLPEQLIAPGEQHKIYSPGIDTDGSNSFTVPVV